MAPVTAPPASASHYSSVEFARVGPNAETQTIPHHIAVETVEEGERMGRHAYPRRASAVTA
ncbi:MAG: hypothetical protein QOG36_1260 [Actinomycetota bacterium]|jgi:hypothetical protein|nr:hypothetical protein [Actinomycetota bacterium]